MKKIFLKKAKQKTEENTSCGSFWTQRESVSQRELKAGNTHNENASRQSLAAWRCRAAQGREGDVSGSRARDKPEGREGNSRKKRAELTGRETGGMAATCQALRREVTGVMGHRPAHGAALDEQSR